MFMYNFDFYTFFFMFLSGLLVFSSMRKHLLISLLSLEYLVLCVFLFFMNYVASYIGDMYVVLMFLTFSVCEGVLGLSILVSLIRCHGSDQVNSLFFLKW